MKTFGPYSPIKQAGNNYFISGQVGINPDTKQASNKIEDQTHQTMKNLSQVLASNDLDISNLVKTTIFLKNIDDFKVINKIYESYFDQNLPKPARSCVEVAQLPKIADNPLLIEIEAVAYK